MIPEKLHPTQAINLPLVPRPAHDPRSGPAVGPTCGRPYFGPASSALLDWVVLTHEQLGHIKAMLETVVMP
jgi:hypothetical protein